MITPFLDFVETYYNEEGYKIVKDLLREDCDREFICRYYCTLYKDKGLTEEEIYFSLEPEVDDDYRERINEILKESDIANKRLFKICDELLANAEKISSLQVEVLGTMAVIANMPMRYIYSKLPLETQRAIFAEHYNKLSWVKKMCIASTKRQ